jgi:hypothetical protein
MGKENCNFIYNLWFIAQYDNVCKANDLIASNSYMFHTEKEWLHVYSSDTLHEYFHQDNFPSATFVITNEMGALKRAPCLVRLTQLHILLFSFCVEFKHWIS